MRKKQINSIMHDLVNLGDWENPLNLFWIEKPTKINLINGKINVDEKDDVTALLVAKRNWLKDRLKVLKGSLKDFEKAEIVIFGAKEKLTIIYKGETYEKERVYSSRLSEKTKGPEDNRLKELEKLKPIRLK